MKMKTYISHSSEPPNVHLAVVSSICAKHKLPVRLFAKALIALALTIAVYDIKAQSAGTAADEPTVPLGWAAGPNLVSPAVRSVGVFFPANGRFYIMGGRSVDTAGGDFIHPFEYNPTTNTWATKAGTYPDNQVNNMACGVLTVSGTPQIYCVGGSAAGAATSTARVFSYNPVTDIVTALTAADNWPGSTGTILPGGFAVTGNKLYIVGGFNINVAMTAQTWQFDPTAAIGSRWLQRLDYPMQRGYIPTTAISGLLYTAGGSMWDGTTLQDTADSFKFDPVANTWTAIANIPRPTGETRALNLGNKMWVMGGGRVDPNPSNEVDIYNPGTNTWTTGLPFVTPRRNFATDTDGSRIWIAGGYTTDGLTPLNTMEIFTGAPVATGAVSRKVHGAFTGDINLPLTGSPGIECRNSGGTEQIVVTFASPVTVSGSTTPPPTAATVTGTGAVSSITVVSNVVTVNLTGVTDVQQITVTLLNVSDGSNSGDVAVPMKVLIGDSAGTGSSSVGASDIAFIKSKSGQTADATNFRADVAINGSIGASDIALAKSKSGNSLP